MKKSLFIAILSILAISFVTPAQAQDVQVGDLFTIEAPSAREYKHIHFPKNNIIMKRGGIVDMDLVKNVEVEVVSVTYTQDSKTLVTLKRTDGGRFFKALFSVEAELEGALESGELSG